jgi:hypothetical protein
MYGTAGAEHLRQMRYTLTANLPHKRELFHPTAITALLNKYLPMVLKHLPAQLLPFSSHLP